MHSQFLSNSIRLPVPPLSPPGAWGRRVGVPSQGDPSPCRMNPLRPDCFGPSPPSIPLRPPLPCALLEGAGAGSRQVQGEERAEGRVVEMVAGWDRVREKGGPAQGPGWQMTPACRPNVPVGFLELEGPWTASMYVCSNQVSWDLP